MRPTLDSPVSDAVRTSAGIRAKKISGSEISVLIAAALILSAGLIKYYDAKLQSSLTATALRLAGNNPNVQRVFGEPLRAQYRPKQDNSDLQEASLTIPVYGPKRRGALRIFADRGAGTWIFSRFQILPQDPSVLPFDIGPVDESPQPANDGSHTALVVRFLSDPLETPQLNTSIEAIRPTLHHDIPQNQLEVDLQTGSFVLRQTDLFLPGLFPVALTRTYRPFVSYPGPFGMSASHPYEIWPTGTRNPYTEMKLNLEDWSQIYYSRISAGTSYEDALYRHDQTSSEFYRSQFFWNDKRWGWTLRLADLRRILFPEAYSARSIAQGAAIEMDDAAGNRLLLKRDRERKLTTILSPDGHRITFQYNDSGQVVKAQDDLGHSRNYEYESTSHVGIVREKAQTLYRFSYERLLDAPGADPFGMTGICDGSGKEILHLTYDRSGEVTAIRLSDSKMIQFAYSYINDNGATKQMTTVTFPNGTSRTLLFD